MRKKSHDGGDSTSITSGVENEGKKSALKPKKSSLKRNAPSFSQESDDTVKEPLLQRDPERPETSHSAKYFIKGKTDSLHDKETVKAKLLNDNKANTTSTTGFCGTTESLLSIKEYEVSKTTSAVQAPIHNYMNTNVFNTHDNSKINSTTKSQILVEINESKQSGYNPSPLIFTTAKIHTDGKSKHMEPVQVTLVPILSTIEVSMSKGGSFTTNEKKVNNGSSLINPVFSPLPINKGKEEKIAIYTSSTASPTSTYKDTFGKAIETTSSSKVSNNSSVPSSFMENNLPSTSMKSFSMITKDNQKDQSSSKNIQPQNVSSNLENIKSNVAVKTTTPSSSGKVNVVEMSTIPTKTNKVDIQTDKSQIPKSDKNSDNITSTKLSSIGSLQLESKIKSPTSSKNLTGISNPVKSIGSAVGNKQLQRQKTTPEETSKVEPKINPCDNLEDSSAKTAISTNASSHSKEIDSATSTRDKLPKICANNTINIITKSPVSTHSTSNVTSLPKPAVTTVSSTNTVTIPTNITSKLALSKPYGKTTEKTVSNSAGTVANINKTCSETIGITKPSIVSIAKTSAIPTSVQSTKSPEVTSVQVASSLNKTVLAKTPVVSTSTAITKTAPMSSVNNEASMTSTKPTVAVTSASITAIAEAPAKSISKNTVTKSPSVATSIKTTSVGSATNTYTKSPKTTTPVTATTKLPTTSVVSSAVTKAPTFTTSITTTGLTSTSSLNTTALQGNASKQSSTIGMSTVTDTPTVGKSAKSPTVNSSGSTTATSTIKSPNNNSAPSPATTQTSQTSIAKTIPLLTSAASASSSVAKTPSVKAQQESSSPTTKKESSISVKKPFIPKTPTVTTKTPSVSSIGNSLVGTSSKIPSSVTTSTSTTAIKQPTTASGKTVLAKTPVTTASSKTAPVTSVTTTIPTTKPSTPNTTQVSSSKPAAVASASVPSSTSVPRQPELTKKTGLKSNENKDDKVSKSDR